MTDPLPEPPSFTPAWLAPASVKDWLRLHDQDASDDDLIAQCCASTEPYVQGRRPEFWKTDPDTGERTTYDPDAEAYQGGVMLAAREYRRRNSPAGIELFGDAASFVARFDPDIDRAMHTGQFADPVLG